MASKSRLGKGLGALFPTLPGEEPVAEQPAMIAEDSSTPAATADITPAKKATAQQESKPAVPQTVSSSKAAKKAAPSDKMFDQMLADYRASLERGRAALTAMDTPKGGGDE